MLKSIARRIFPEEMQQLIRRLLGRDRIAQGHEVLIGDVPLELLKGWQNADVAQQQHAAFEPLLLAMYEGNPREDFSALTSALELTGLDYPLIIEVGCGSGWNCEVLTHLLKRPVRYIGLDYSKSMTALGRQHYSNARFVVGDATALPLGDGVCDILLSGTVLMHLMDYGLAIQESRRVSRSWCIFHTVPILQKRATTRLSKMAYGRHVAEVVLNEGELLELLNRNGLVVRHVLPSIAYDLEEILMETTRTCTYVCQVV